jgi:sulfide:quinone oxidoreductase
MEIRQLTDDFAVSPQIDAAHMKEIAGAGFRSVLCNRPDGEDPGQATYTAIEQAAANQGLEIRWIPVVSGMVTPATMTEFKTALSEMPTPILAYCRSGTRCTMLWAIAQYGRLDDHEIVTRAAKAGYDMAPLLQSLSRQ